MKLEPKKVESEVKQERVYNKNDKVQHAIHTNDWSGTEQRPNKKCKECYSTGSLGYDIVRKRYIKCSCIEIPKPKELSQV